MKHDNSRKARQDAAAMLMKLGAPMDFATYDVRADGRRYSVFRGQVTAIWDDAHFEKHPFGTYPILEAA